MSVAELKLRKEGAVSAVLIGVTHLAKCLEFKAVAVMACDDRYVLLQERFEAVADEVELDAVYATERQLFYVACMAALRSPDAALDRSLGGRHFLELDARVRARDDQSHAVALRPTGLRLGFSIPEVVARKGGVALLPRVPDRRADDA